MQPLRLAPLWLLGALGVATALALLAPLGWPFELFAHFRLQYAAAALLIAAWLGAQRRATAAALALLLAAWHGWPLLSAGTPPSACAGPGFTVATVNVNFANERREPALAWLVRQSPDLVAVQEVSEAWAADLEALEAYPHRHLLVREDPYGIGVLSRWPLEAVEEIDLARDGLPSLTGLMTIDGRRVRFLALHARWPVLPDLARARDRALLGAAARARGADLPVVVLGDLNLSPFAPGFARLLADGRLTDALAGQAWRPTWLAGFWPLALRIDHVLLSPGLCASQVEVGPPIGSDHRPVVAELHFAERSGPSP